jgi:hypothetical protein
MKSMMRPKTTNENYNIWNLDKLPLPSGPAVNFTGLRDLTKDLNV